MVLLLFSMRPSTVVGAYHQIPAGGVVARALPPPSPPELSHCGGITAIAAPFADENGRNEPAETAAATVIGRRHRGGERRFATTVTSLQSTATTPSAAYQDGALRDGRAAAAAAAAAAARCRD